MRLLRFVLIALLLASAVSVFVVGSKTGSAPLPPGFVKIQYWEKWTGNEGHQMELIVNQFNATVGREKHIFVEYTSISDVDRKTLAATAAGVPPDVAGLWAGQLVQYAAMDALEPLDDYAAEHHITSDLYKPIYWKACHYDGHLWCLISTPASIALHYNKEVFQQHATDLRTTGFDPDRPPQTLVELDKYAEILTTYDTVNGKKHTNTFGLVPLEPGWYVPVLPGWFGGEIFDPATNKLTLTSPQVVAAFDWIASYSRKFGKDSISEFRSGLGNFNSPQNGFLSGAVAMEQQGPWMANYIEDLAPKMNRWHITDEQWSREKNFPKLQIGMTQDEVAQILGAPIQNPQSKIQNEQIYDAGIKTITLTFDDNIHLATKQMTFLPAKDRRNFTQWGVAPYPSSDPNSPLTSYVDFDMLVIPRTAAHKKEAFEFIAFVNRQDVMESLCSMHCKNSPLAKVSRQFIDYHPNPYIQVFEDCANSPNAFATPQIPIWPEISDELTVASQKVYMLEQSPQDAMKSSQDRLEQKWEYFSRIQQARRAEASAQSIQ